ncbi:MAG: hypothetical protein CME65_14265 [Halobacteriovoraceae bacterium]|nr:hypothetical protein [Halobacteriovoraceae bacterium]
MRILLVMLLSLTAFAEETPFVGQEFENKVRSLYNEEHEQYIAPKIMTRTEVLQRAYSALNYSFKIENENTQSSTQTNSCYGSHTWLKPYRLYNQEGKTLKSIPYKWGGYFLSLDSFTEGLSENKLAGDVCTCSDSSRGWCINQETIGLDCSGFVSFAWKSAYHITSTMHKITDPISWNELKPGDVMNRAGSHVIMFVRYSKDKNYIWGIESSVTCEGICERSFRTYDMKRDGYIPLRYKNIKD